MSTSERHLVLDATNTAITFEVRWFGVIPIRGTFARLHGVLELGEDSIARSTVRLDVEAGSVSTGIGLRDRHLRGPRFLFADLHPFVSFKSTAVRQEHGRLVVDGTLSLRGRETVISTTCPLDEVGEGHGSVDMSGAFVIPRRPFDIGVPPGLAGLNPLFHAIAGHVTIHVRLRVPVARLRPALQNTAAR